MQQPQLTTRRQSLGQIVFCLGCCCERTERGRPEVPVERLKDAWRTKRLNSIVQLTISGCLGPCDLANVALLILPAETVWLGGFAGNAVYDAAVTWAEHCQSAGRILPLPHQWEPHRFERFANHSNRT